MTAVASPRIDRLLREIETEPAALAEFWADVVRLGTPLVEPLDADTSLVTFLWRGTADTTTVEWGVELALHRLAGTDLWHGTTLLPSRLRTVYFLGHDGVAAVPTTPGDGPTHIDPINQRPLRFPGDPLDPTDRDNWASLLELPLAPPEPWLTPPDPDVRGSTVTTTLNSRALRGPRHVSVHLPAGIAPYGLPVLVVFDANLSRTVLGIPTTVDNLIAAGRIPPLVLILIHTPDALREDELEPSQSIVDFIGDEVVPWARDRWRLSADPAHNAIGGASRGGLVAAHIALRRPDLFGAVISQSGSFWWPRRADGEPEWLTRQFAAGPRQDLRFYLDVGDREDGPGFDGGPSQVATNRRLRDTLRDKRYPVTYAEYAGGHDYVNWRRTFADGLLAVLAHDARGERG